MIENIVPYVNGRPFDGWNNFRMSQQLQSVHANVSFEALENPNLDSSFWLPQNELKVLMNDEGVFTGNIDTYDEVIGSDRDGQVTHSTSLTSRSLSSVISDSVFPEIQGLQISGGTSLSLGAFMISILRPFNLNNNFEIKGTPQSLVKHTRLSPYNTVEKELRNGLLTMRSATVVPTATGGIKIIVNSEYDRVGTISNLKRIKLSVNEQKRYHTYEITNQTVTGTPVTAGTASGPKTIATSTDKNVKQTERITRLKAVGNSSNSQEYADWINNTTFAKSRKISISIVGFRNEDGVLYQPGQLVRLSGVLFDASKASGINEWLIDKVVYQQAYPGAGTKCELSLVHPDAYNSDPRVTSRGPPDPFGE